MEEQMGQLENKKQDGRFKSDHINNNIKRKFSNKIDIFSIHGYLLEKPSSFLWKLVSYIYVLLFKKHFYTDFNNIVYQ